MIVALGAGVGKTTLAHVAARHCGYRVVEINASDERSRSALLSAAAAAVQMQPVLGDRRPNCLVIDEIDGALGGGAGDGAGGGAVSAIAEIIRTGRVRVKDAEGPSGGKGGSVPLLRPVICICNDLYTPALRPLREVAEVLEVGPPEDRMLRARLREVCRRERANVAEEVRARAPPMCGALTLYRSKWCHGADWRMRGLACMAGLARVGVLGVLLQDLMAYGHYGPLVRILILLVGSCHCGAADVHAAVSAVLPP